jgi:hypothetical protein
MAIIPLLIFLVILPIALLATAFWIWMLVDCSTKEPSQGNDKIIWILVIIFTHWIGALIYYLVRRPERQKQFGV